MNLEDQYDRIFKYLYFHLHDEHLAEEMTQDTFLRFLASRTYRDENRQIQYLYTIARHLCSQYYRDRKGIYSFEEIRDIPISNDFEDSLLQNITLQEALEALLPEEREMLFLRYINEVPISILSGLYSISRFAVYRKLKRILRKLRSEMEGNKDG